MPNRNTNFVTISAPEDQVRAYLTTDEHQLLFNMHKLFPETFPDTDPAGRTNWNYDWAIANTGTKWFPEVWITSDASEPETTLGYDTARWPNNLTLQKLHELTGWDIVNEYEESGMCFEGTFSCSDGSCSDDERDYLSPCEICEEKKTDEEYDDEADDHICNDCRKNPSKPIS
jgi:hypothetical protein